MGKYIPFMMVVMTVLLPAWFATRPRSPKRTVKTMAGVMALFIVVWAYLCMRVYTRYVFLE